MLPTTAFTEEDKQKITDAVRALAKFEEGDRVTVEPDGSPFDPRPSHFEEYAGVHLTVDDVMWRGNDLHSVREGGRNAPEHSRYSDEHYVTLEGEYEHFNPESVLITSWEYTFQERDTRPLAEGGLISWEEYRDEYDVVHLKPRVDGKYEYIRPLADDEEPCPVCGCEQRNISGNDQKVVHVGTETCAACDEQFGWWD